MFKSFALASLALASVARAQNVGTNTAEKHPSLGWTSCSKTGGCQSQTGSVTVDANWRWTHTTSGYTNCYTGQTWDKSLCPDGATCAQNCAVDGADYAGTYGVTSTGSDLTLKFVTQATQKNVGSRLYLMDPSDTKYQMFKLKNKEFTFDVDVSNLGCGLNGALYFVEMDADGGMAKNPANKAGAKYGTGYCDAQCPRDVKWINGKANVEGWTGSSTDPNSGTGNTGSCCNEMDIWEANSISTAFTPHACSATGLKACTAGSDCTSICDQPGCDFNSFRLGNQSFYGPGKAVDTTKRMTVVTQFITADGTDTGALSEIRRLYVQNGKVISNSKTNVPGITTTDSISPKFCTESKSAFAESEDAFNKYGGFSTMDASFSRGHVLVLSLWDDHAANMLWLDSQYPVGGNPAQPGIARGSCPTNGGDPAVLESTVPNSSVTFGSIKFGDIGTTYNAPAPVASSAPATTSRVASSTSRFVTSTTSAAPATSTTSASPATSSAASVGTVPLWGQCGGKGYTGPTTCAQGKCVSSGEYYSQCLN